MTACGCFQSDSGIMYQTGVLEMKDKLVELLALVDSRASDAEEKSRVAKTGYIESSHEGRLRELYWMHDRITELVENA